MLNLNDREWKTFTIADIFDIKAGKRLTTADMDHGKLPFIGATELNNGITNWINTPNETLDHNVLGVNYNGSVAEAFYHPYYCVFSDDVKRLHLKNVDNNKYVLLFCSIMIRKQKSKYTYGYKFNGNRMAKQKILLPITPEGTPDYTFMEQYVKEREDKLKQKYIDFIGDMQKNGGVLLSLENKTWATFKVLDLFDYKRGNQNNMNSLANGNDMLISAKNINNGLKGFYTSTNDKKGTYKGNCITLNNDGDGGVGLAYYQPYKFLLDTHVYALYPKENINYFVMLYLSQSLSKQRACFSHGYSISQDRLTSMKIMLPVNDEGEPDYTFMEHYVKAVMFGKYKKYLECQSCSV